MPKIIISYRRSDSQVITGRIHDKLSAYYGRNAVFIDIETIPAGEDFPSFIAQSLKDCDVVLAIIGPHWEGAGPEGRSRLDDPEDWVRIEIETALRERLRIIPVLVDRPQMPPVETLPPSLQPLYTLNAVKVDGGVDFHPHTDRLIHAIDQILRERQSALGFLLYRLATIVPRAALPVASVLALIGIVAIVLALVPSLRPGFLSQDGGDPLERLRANTVLVVAEIEAGSGLSGASTQVAASTGFFVSPNQVLTAGYSVDRAKAVLVGNPAMPVRTVSRRQGDAAAERQTLVAVLDAGSHRHVGFLRLAAGVEPGEEVRMAAYPQAALKLERGVLTVTQPGGAAAPGKIPPATFSFARVRSVQVGNDGREVVHYDMEAVPGTGGAPLVNRCGEVVALHHTGVNARGGSYSIGVSARELQRILQAYRVAFEVAPKRCGSGP